MKMGDKTLKESSEHKGYELFLVEPQLGQRCRTKKSMIYSLDFTVTPHMLRYTYITNLISEGVDPKTVQYLAGQENSKVTMDIYAGVKYNKPWELAKAVNDAFDTPETEGLSPKKNSGLTIGGKLHVASRNPLIYRAFREKSIQYGLKAARRAPQFSKR